MLISLCEQGASLSHSIQNVTMHFAGIGLTNLVLIMTTFSFITHEV